MVLHLGGTYVLDLNVLRDGSRLKADAPYLVVFEQGGTRAWIRDQMTDGAVAFFLLAPIGTFLLIRAAIWRRVRRLDALARDCSLTQPWYQLRQPVAAAGGSRSGTAGEKPRKAPAPAAARVSSLSVPGYRYPKPKPNPANRPAFARMPWTALIMLLCCLVIAAPILNPVLNPPVPWGLKIRILRPGVQSPSIPGIRPLLVRVARGRELFVDSQAVSWEDFDSVLRKELSRRPPNWPVYLEGDPNLEWGWPARVIDHIRGLQADVVLVTRSP